VRVHINYYAYWREEGESGEKPCSGEMRDLSGATQALWRRINDWIRPPAGGCSTKWEARPLI